MTFKISIISTLAKLLDDLAVVFNTKNPKIQHNLTSSDGKLFINLWNDETQSWFHSEITEPDLIDLMQIEHVLKEQMRREVKKQY